MSNPTVISYVIVAASTAVIALTVNYNLLIWSGKSIPDSMVPLITGLATGVFTAVTFKPPDKPER